MTGGVAGTAQIAISGTLTNSTNSSQTAIYTVTPTANGCPGATFTVTVTVNPKPFVANHTTAICSEAAFTLTPSNGSGNIIATGTTYTWTISSNTNITGQSSSSVGGITSISQTLVNVSNAVQTITYTVTPTSGDTGNCIGSNFTITVTVNPKPFVLAQTPAICSGTAFTVTPSNGNGNIIPIGTTYTWALPVSNPVGAITGGVAQTTAQASISQILVNTTNDVATLTYTVTPKSGTCEADTYTITVTVNPVPKSLSLTNQVYCNGVVTSPIVFSNTVTGTTYAWTNSNTEIGLAASGTGDVPSFSPSNGTISPITATISVIATANGCSRVAETFTITVNPSPSITFSPAPQTICSEGSTAAVTLSSTTLGVTFAWTADQPAGISGITTTGTNTIPVQTLVNNTNAPITVTYSATASVSGGASCSGAVFIYKIIVNPKPAITESFTAATCSESGFTVTPSDLIINIIPTGTTYSWSAPTVTGGMTGGVAGTAQIAISGTLTNSTNSSQTAIYTVTPTANGCPGATFTVTVTVNPKPDVIFSLPSQTICSGSNTKLVNFSSTTLGNITYNWTANVPTGITGVILSGNTSFIPVQTISNSTSVPQTVQFIVHASIDNGVACQGLPFYYSIIINPSIITSSILSNYSGFNISNAGGNNGSIDVTVNGGSGNYTYLWSGPNGFTATTQDISNAYAGDYSLSISDGVCAPVILTFLLTEPLPLLIDEELSSHIDVKCFGDLTGVIEVKITQTSAGPYNYSIALVGGAIVHTAIDVTATNYTFTGLAEGTYIVTVSDLYGSNKAITTTISQPANALTIANTTVSNYNGFSISCFGSNNGSIDLQVSGGTAPYNYQWTGPNSFSSINKDISGLEPGNYSVFITDAAGCSKSNNYTITEPSNLVLATNLKKDITCFNDANGEIKITVTGGTLNYNYTWTKDGIPYSTTEDISNLSPGIYDVTVSDANNCNPKTATFSITQPPILAVSLISQTNILCFGEATGAIDIAVVGGTPTLSGYNFAWTGPNGFTSSNKNLIVITAGTYNVLVTDNSGCSKALSVTLTQPTAIILSATTTPIICYGSNDASISLAINGGITPYSITWSNLGGGTFQDNLSAGDYLITVTDSNNCVKTLNVNIPEAPIFTINPVVKNISCFGAQDGSINLNIIGGIAPVKLVWDDSIVAGNVRNNLAPGSYTVTIVDSKPCTIKKTFIIIEPQPLILSANITNAFDCDNADSGAINLLVAGGTPPFTYSWSNGSTTEDLGTIPAGNYLITVTDSRGCSKQAQYSINRQPPIVIGVATKTEFDCETKFVKQTFVAQVSGGIPPYQLAWSSGTVSGSNNEMMNTSQNGTAILYVTDALGCKANYSFNVKLQSLGTPSFNATSYSYVTYGTYSIIDPIQFTNAATGDFISLVWDFGDGSFSTELNPVHTFLNPKEYVVTQTVTYPFGCIYVQKITFIVKKGYVLVVPTAFTPNNDNFNDTFRPVTKALKNVRLDIYDTWGSLIYSETGDTLKGWDGKIKGQNAENGNYYCKVSAETFYGTIVNENHPFVIIK